MMSQKLLNKLLVFFIIIIVSLVCFIFFVFSKPIKPEKINYEKKESIELEDIKAITGQNLYLSPFQVEITLPSIKDQIEIYLMEPRFDLITQKNNFEVKFKNFNKTRKIYEDERLYLVAKQGDSFDFSDVKTPISMQLKKIDSENVKVTLEADLNDLDIKDSKESVFDSFTLALTNLSSNADLDDRYEFKAFNVCKWWGIDHLLNIQDKERPQKERLEIDGEILHVQEKDVLIFKEGKWVLINSLENTLDYPIARIKSINANTIEIEAWDISGENKYFFSILPCPKAAFVIKGDQLITSLKKRTKTHVSCMFDKQRMVLKENDLLIKKDNRWKLLKRDVVLDDIKNEELFYFEKIEDRNSKKILIGYLFNSMRTNFQKIEVPIISFANQRHLKKR